MPGSAALLWVTGDLKSAHAVPIQRSVSQLCHSHTLNLSRAIDLLTLFRTIAEL